MITLSEETTTRVEDVTAAMEAVEEKWGADNLNKMIAACIKDINLSLAMLVDNSTTPSI